MSAEGNNNVHMEDGAEVEIPGRWIHINKVLDRGGPLAGPDFKPDTVEHPHLKRLLQQDFHVLVIGAGGLGCEILKNLALSGFRNIDVIDMDTIDISNLNRQFLFRQSDVGKSKAIAAAAFINKRVPGAKVTPHFKKIQDFEEDFYRGFNLVIAGLDSIEARRWINGLLVNMVVTTPEGNIDPDTIIPMIDGGTEGFKGQARVILPRLTSCFECSLEAFPPQVTYPLCTLATTPRLPEHCIQWASLIGWNDKELHGFPIGTKIDTDNPDHMTWLYESAKKRADQHKIQGVTYKLTQGVVKNIIPAIASTNAIIAAACCNEAFKICTNTSGNLNNYMMYNGVNGIYTYTFEYEQKEGCAVCGSNVFAYEISRNTKLQALLDSLHDDPKFQLRRPSLRCGKINLYMQGMLESTTRPNLDKTLPELGLQDGDEIGITDPSLPGNLSLRLKVKFT
jgi:ubiquitin-activating enzyme E1 C